MDDGKTGDRLQIAQQKHQSFGRFDRANSVPVSDFHPGLANLATDTN
jgi:hypothetical protein